MSSHISNDFFGHLKGKSVEEKKMEILSIYNYFFRFAQVKMQTFVEDPLLMLFTVKYVQDTSLIRIH